VTHIDINEGGKMVNTPMEKAEKANNPNALSDVWRM
jgi:hypothetical protein